jgi:hypothetical protein
MIKFILDTVSSRRDIYGNCYHAAFLTRLSDGAKLQGIVDAPSNVRSYLHRCDAARFGEQELHETETELPIREFNRLVKGFDRLDEKAITTFATGAL